MDLPIPTHLQPYFIPIGDNNCEYEVTGKIQCSCENEEFEVWESNHRRVIKLVCRQCRKEIVLFDAGKHGWNGFVCDEARYINRARPFEKYICSQCHSDGYNIIVQIDSQGKEDFIEECVAYDNSFSADDWVNGFECIAVSISCGECNVTEENWMIEETM